MAPPRRSPLLDASGDDSVELRLCGVDADLTLLDTIDLMGVPVHATCLREPTGAAVAILTATDHRTAGPHATLQLRQPRTHRSRGPPAPTASRPGAHRGGMSSLRRRRGR